MDARRAKVIEEARSLHTHVGGLLRRDLERFPGDIERCLAHDNPGAASGCFRGIGGNALIAGMSWYRLHGDVEQARAAFGSMAICDGQFEICCDWLDRRKAGGYDKSKQRDDDPKCWFSTWNLIEPLFALVLANDRSSALSMAERCANPELQHGGWLQLITQILTDTIDPDFVDIFTKEEPGYFTITHYFAPAVCLARGDAEGLQALVPVMEKSFRARSRTREMAVEWGHGRLGQEMSFDFPGTGLLRIARWRGMTVEADSDIHPRIFIEA